MNLLKLETPTYLLSKRQPILVRFDVSYESLNQFTKWSTKFGILNKPDKNTTLETKLQLMTTLPYVSTRQAYNNHR